VDTGPDACWASVITFTLSFAFVPLGATVSTGCATTPRCIPGQGHRLLTLGGVVRSDVLRDHFGAALLQDAVASASRGRVASFADGPRGRWLPLVVMMW